MNERNDILIEEKRVIDMIDKWNVLSSVMKEKGYWLYQMQYSYDSPEGFHAWFQKSDRIVEVITFSKQVAESIVKYNNKSE